MNTAPMTPATSAVHAAAVRPLAAAPAGAGPLVPAPVGARRAPPRRWASQQILDGAAEIEIEHHGAVYRLRVTSLGKLILTK